MEERHDLQETQIQNRKVPLMSLEHENPGAGLGDYLTDVESSLAALQSREVISRIWSGDHTVWKPDPTEISNRLEWLTVTDAMREQAPVMHQLAGEVRDAGTRHVVLLGMGGSSLGPEVLRQTFGSAPGYPELIVLDSTVPSWVQSVTDAIDPARTLFLVSSKSGSTTEPNMFYAYFRDLVEKAAGKDGAGQHFIAITDAGTSLDKLAIDQGFRRVIATIAADCVWQDLGSARRPRPHEKRPGHRLSGCMRALIMFSMSPLESACGSAQFLHASSCLR